MSTDISIASQLCTRFVRSNRAASSVSPTRHNPERGRPRTEHERKSLDNRGGGDPIAFEHAVPCHQGNGHIHSERIQDCFSIPSELETKKKN